MLRIAIVDDHTLFRKSLTLLIKDFERMEVVLEAANGIELLEKLKIIPVDIILLDLQMPVMNGFEAFKNVKEQYPHIKSAILTLMKDVDTIREVIKMKAHGYFTKNTSPKELENAIWNLKDNGFYFEKSFTSVINQILNDNLEIYNTEIKFTNREIEIITLIVQGLKAKEIADLLFISTKTVNAHKQNIQHKYGFENMMSVILYCINNKIIDLDKNSSKYS